MNRSIQPPPLKTKRDGSDAHHECQIDYRGRHQLLHTAFFIYVQAFGRSENWRRMILFLRRAMKRFREIKKPFKIFETSSFISSAHFGKYIHFPPYADTTTDIFFSRSPCSSFILLYVMLCMNADAT